MSNIFQWNERTFRHAGMGQSLTEYGLVIGLVAMVGVASLNLLGDGVAGHFKTLASNFGGEGAHQPAAVALPSGSGGASGSTGAAAGDAIANLSGDSSGMAGSAAAVPESNIAGDSSNTATAPGASDSLSPTDPTQTLADTLVNPPASTTTTEPVAGTATTPTPAITTGTSAEQPDTSVPATQPNDTPELSSDGQAATLFCDGHSQICNGPVDSGSAWGW